MAAPVVRIILFTFNFLFFADGVIMLSFGIVGLTNPQALASCIWWIPGVQSVITVVDIPSVIVNSATFMVVLGSIMMVFGFLGCAGVAFNSKWMLFIYWVLLSALLLAEIALIIYAAVAPGKAAVHVQGLMYTSLHTKYEPVKITGSMITLPPNVVAIAWVSMQFEVGCCGVMNASDYERFNWTNTVSLPTGEVSAKVPPSCCTMTKTRVVPKDINIFVNLDSCLELEGYYNNVGCYASVHALMVQYSYIPIGICSAVICIELVAITLSIYLWRLRSKKSETV